MNESADKFALLDSAQYLYLRQIIEPRDNALRIVLQEAIATAKNFQPRFLEYLKT